MVLLSKNHLDEPNKISKNNFRSFQLLGAHASIERRFSNLLAECCSERTDSVRVYATIGRLVGSDTRKPVFLPVLTETVLEPSASYQFVESVPRTAIDSVLLKLFTQSRDSWELTGGTEKTVLESYYDDDVTVSIQRISEPNQLETKHNESVISANRFKKRYLQICRLGHMTIFRPTSNLHIRLCCISRRAIDNETELLNSSKEKQIVSYRKRKISYWNFRAKSHLFPGPGWKLAVSSVVDIIPPPVNIDILEWLQSANSVGENNEPIITIRILADTHEIKNQCDYLREQQPHGLLRLSSELLLHAKSMAKLIESEYHEDNQDYRVYYYPSYFGDVAAQARRHYNTKKINVASRSPIEALRRLNNEVKHCLIEDYVVQHASVLDLACGHGQDILKYVDKHLTRFVGVDISSEEILEAIRRMRVDKIKTLTCPWKFFVGNLLEEKIFQDIGDDVYDVVSIQLAIHYCVQSEKIADDLFFRISKKLKNGGMFIGSTGDCNQLATRICTKLIPVNETEGHALKEGHNSTVKKYYFGNSVYRVIIDNQTLINMGTDQSQTNDIFSNQKLYNETNLETIKQYLNTTWGIQYTFWLIAHIDATEYVVPWESFCSIAERHGLKLIKHQRFDEFMAEQMFAKPRVKHWVQETLERLPKNSDEIDAFSFYKVFAFQKIIDDTKDTMFNNGINPMPSHSDTNPITALPISESATNNLVNSNTLNNENTFINNSTPTFQIVTPPSAQHLLLHEDSQVLSDSDSEKSDASSVDSSSSCSSSDSITSSSSSSSSSNTKSDDIISK